MENKEIINALCGENKLSSQFVDLLNVYDLSVNVGLEIRKALLEESKYIKGSFDERKGFLMRQFIGEILNIYEENHDETINVDDLASYINEDDVWDLSIDRFRTINILEENYMGKWPNLNDIFLKDLVKFNLLGKFANIYFSLFSIPSKEFEGKDIRKYLLDYFDEMNLIDEIEKRHPKSIEEAIDCLIRNMNIDEINRIKSMDMGQYSLGEHFYLGMWIRNEFGINQGINSELLYDCYLSEYNDSKYKGLILYTPDTVSNVILKALWDYVDRNFDRIKDYKFTSKINRRKYMLD